MKRIRVLAVTVAAGYAALILSAVPASAAEEAHSSVRGTTGNDFVTFTVDAENTGPGTAATGWFEATGDVAKLAGPLKLPIGATGAFHFEGPVTCLDVRGSRVGLIYPIESATGTVGKYFKGMAVYITIIDGGPVEPDRFGFLGPAPLSSLKTCPPLVTFFGATFGHLVAADAD